jgi:hypothetical protein
MDGQDRRSGGSTGKCFPIRKMGDPHSFESVTLHLEPDTIKLTGFCFLGFDPKGNQSNVAPFETRILFGAPFEAAGAPRRYLRGGNRISVMDQRAR